MLQPMQGPVCGFFAAQTQATTALVGQLVTLPLRAAGAVWNQFTGVGRTTAEQTTTRQLTPPVPDDAASDDAVPEDAAPEDAAPDDAAPDDAAPDENWVDVTFRLPASVDAQSAAVCGEFNDWSPTADPMERLDDGSFALTRRLPVGERLRFRYLLDGNRWENDWAADDYLPNAFGESDSVVDLRTAS